MIMATVIIVQRQRTTASISIHISDYNLNRAEAFNTNFTKSFSLCAMNFYKPSYRGLFHDHYPLLQ